MVYLFFVNRIYRCVCPLEGREGDCGSSFRFSSYSEVPAFHPSARGDVGFYFPAQASFDPTPSCEDRRVAAVYPAPSSSLRLPGLLIPHHPALHRVSGLTISPHSSSSGYTMLGGGERSWKKPHARHFFFFFSVTRFILSGQPSEETNDIRISHSVGYMLTSSSLISLSSECYTNTFFKSLSSTAVISIETI